MIRTSTLLALVAISLSVGGCGGGSAGSSGTGNPTAPSASNHPPSITAASSNPSWGIATLTTHAFTAAANDPDGDAITFNWDYGNGSGVASASGSVTYNNANSTIYQATVTVTDSKGATATATVPVNSLTVAGTWSGTLLGGALTVNLTQFLGGLVQGSWQQPSLGYSGDVGPTGEPGKIQANGQFELRFKVKQGRFTDFYYRGTMDPTGQFMTGTLQGSGFTGDYMRLSKQ